ncbi:copper resistance D family protein [Kutzneria sp. 744]|uniref:copper resistance D family protein n=1 Tax=Kutzneria sp. (strain 744) TaxID=345341 RepID=UPI0004B6BBA1|nr:CopD family protein [Kutzneria sp. 744]
MTTAHATRAATTRSATGLVAVVAVGGIVGVTAGLALSATAAVAVPGLVQPSAVVAIALPLARLALDIAALVTAGASLAPVLLGCRHSDALAELALARRVAVLGSLAWALAAVATLVLQAANADPGAGLGAVIGYAAAVPSAMALVVVFVGALVGLVVNAAALRDPLAVRRGWAVAVVVATMLPLPPSGHTSDETGAPRVLGTVTIELHVLAAMAWTGGLLAVIALLGMRRALLAQALPRFSQLATVCVFTTAATGLLSGLTRLALTPGLQWYSALFTTDYGHLLIGKGICVLVVGLLGAHIRFRLLPRISSVSRPLVLRWVVWELMVMGAAFGLAAVLVGSPVA